MTILSSFVLFLLAVPVALSCTYLAILTALSARPRIPPIQSRTLCFDVIVPAHNEASIIERTITSLLAIDWPKDRYRVVVVADNCTDETAAVAAAAGADVLVRNEPSKRGKGYALQYAFLNSRDRQWAEAVVVVDADSEVSPNILGAFAARIQSGMHAIQSHYGVRNPMASWRTRLITIAKGSFHIVRSRARERLGLSCGIRGNGWCVTHALLAEVPYQAFSLTEDVEYGIAIGLAGHRVAYADEAHSDADMVSNDEIARKQRQRWEDGRMQLIRGKTLGLLAGAFKLRSAICLDLAIDLLVLPLSYVALGVIALAALAAAAVWLHLSPPVYLWVAALSSGCLVIYVMRGWQLSGVGLRGIWDLARVPSFLAWKVASMLRRRESKEWIRTKRENG